MLSKERVQAVFNHSEPDCVPVNYLCNPGIDARLKQHFNLSSDDDEGLRQALQLDFRFLEPLYVGPRLHDDPGKENYRVNEQLGFRTRYAEHETGGYWDFCDHPLREADLETVANWPLPSPDDFDYASFASQCQQYKDFGILIGGPGVGDIMNTGGGLVHDGRNLHGDGDGR